MRVPCVCMYVCLFAKPMLNRDLYLLGRCTHIGQDLHDMTIPFHLPACMHKTKVKSKCRCGRGASLINQWTRSAQSSLASSLRMALQHWVSEWHSGWSDCLFGACYLIMLLLQADLQRRTVYDNDDGAFLTSQFWFQPATETLWWDLQLLMQTMRQACSKLQKKCHWLQVLNQRVSVDIPNEPPFQIRQKSNDNGEVSSEFLNTDICNSRALYTFATVSIDRCKHTVEAQFFISSLCKLLSRVCGSSTAIDAGGVVQVGAATLEIDRAGQVIGFNNILDQLHQTSRQVLEREPWPDCKLDLSSSIN